MKTIRTLAYAVALGSVLSSVTLAVQAADIPLGSKAMEGEIKTKVLAVDADNHRVTIAGADNTPVMLQLTDQAKALHNLKVGDNVTINVARSIAYELNTEVGGAPKVRDEAMIIRATKDNPNPGGEAVRQVEVTSKITKIDLKTHEVTLMPPEGKLAVIKVENPDLQAKMKDLVVGQTVNAIYTEVLKVETSR